MIDIKTPFSDGWWLNHLANKLQAKIGKYQELDDYYCGEANFPGASTMSNKNMLDEFNKLKRLARLNFSELIVEAVRERMEPMGFNTGAAEDITGDDEAWRIWQANSLDADIPILFRHMLSMGAGYVIINGVDDTINAPLITIEDPREVIVECDPAIRRRVVAAAKIYRDNLNQRLVAILFLPGRVRHAELKLNAAQMFLTDKKFDASIERWDWVPGSDARLPFSDIPVVPFFNRPNGNNDGVGEFEKHLPLIDRIMFEIFNRLVVVLMQSFKQRAFKGLPTTDPMGNPIDYSGLFQASAGTAWQLPEGVDIWESAQVDLTSILMSIEGDLKHLAAATRTPLFYLTSDAINGSAEGASLSREGLIFKTNDRIKTTSEGLEKVISIAFKYLRDNERANRENITTIWKNPEQFTINEKMDAATKAASIGMPFREICKTILQLTPAEIERIEAERAAEKLAALGIGTDVTPTLDPADIRARADSMGVLIRSGVEPNSAAKQVGLNDITFTGAVPVTLRLPASEAQGLENTNGSP